MAYSPAMRHTFDENPTIFGKILRGEIPCQKVYEDDQFLAFHDIAPKAPVHVLVIPKRHLEGLQDAQDGDQALLGQLMVTANKIATELGLKDKGYRLITNAGKGAGQEVPHLHLHILSGPNGLPGF